MRAEELVAEIYRQKTELQREGKKPCQVILSMEAWRHIRAWHLARGVMEQAPHMDYIGEDRIFEMDVLIDGVESPRVC
ncbi:hypothetical protein [Oceanispirochaeta sp.]|jgi:hypothetical protein|uniref:hypothetical protein n=1 Tax=Oceanispirochaeta sp. TaxID=2035350 RepID=UPI00260CB3F0|nr:hypothetical protein [Oceanispirochaeta sp.]MDA3955167.1 hypothetical protein [Oceanispirochaeta sp.]